MIRKYRIGKRNSTVCGYPGRDFDWTKFDWDGQSIFVSIFKGVNDMKAPLPWVDDGLIGENNQYLHVPYDFKEQGTIYRVRPNESMRAGETYKGKLVKQTKVFREDGEWYWALLT